MHRSAIGNVERVRAIITGESGDAAVQLGGDRQVPMSRRYRKALWERVAAGAG